MFALPAMAILAAVLLLPAWKSYQDTQYELACQQAEVARSKEAMEANQRLIKILQEDPNVTIRLAMSQGPVEPANEIFIKDPRNPPRLPMMTMPKRTQRPAPPSGPLIEAAGLVSNTKVQRGLILLTFSAVLGGVLMFWPKKN